MTHLITAPPTDESAYTLRCADADVSARLRAWLRGSELAWPGHFEIDVLVTETSPFPDEDRVVVRQPATRIYAGPPTGTVRIEWDNAPAIAIVDAELPKAQLWLSPAAADKLEDGERSFLLVMLVFLLKRIGWYHVHGAALIDPRGRGWLIAGTSHCGKSTTTALMATRAWQIATDDIGFLHVAEGRVVVQGFRSHIALRPGGFEMLGAAGGTLFERRSKHGFHAEELGGTWAPQVAPSIIAFPRLGEHTSIERAVPRAALSEIVKNSSWVLYEGTGAQAYLDVIGKLAAQGHCYHLTLGPDLFDHPNLLEELVP